jgi:hypothetical protein
MHDILLILLYKQLTFFGYNTIQKKGNQYNIQSKKPKQD